MTKQTTPASHSNAKATRPARPIMDVIPASNAKAAHQRVQPAKTLMRQTVKKPGARPKRAFKAVVPAHGSAALPQVIVKPSVAELDAERLRHARHVAQSHLIQHFNPLSPQMAPIEPPAAGTVIKPTTSVHPPREADVIRGTAKTHDLLQKALEQASSHQQKAPAKQRKRRKLFRRGGAALGVLLLAGLILQHEMPSVRVQLASRHAGFAASLPAYKPSGFTLSQLNAAAGEVAINFHSTSDQRSYIVTEKLSNWDSAALRQVFVAAQTGNDYQTVETAGRTIYIYGKRSATWVNGGIWYTVEAKDSLSQRQLLDLATSL